MNPGLLTSLRVALPAIGIVIFDAVHDDITEPQLFVALIVAVAIAAGAIVDALYVIAQVNASIQKDR